MAEHDPVNLVLLIQTLMILLALGLAVLAGVTPWQDLQPSGAGVLLAIAGTAPVVLLLALLGVLQPRWFVELEVLVRPTLVALFRERGHGAIIAVAVLAGISEELLFRGVLQAWLASLGEPWVAVATASVVFGLLHYLSRAYFLYATGLGLYLGALYELTGNLFAVCLIHAFYDWVAIRYVMSSSYRS